jgi:hypothetical protein
MLTDVFASGKLSSQDSKSFVDLLKSNKVYRYDTKYVLKRSINGKQVYVYNIEFAIAPYLDSLASYIKSMGLSELTAEQKTAISSSVSPTIKAYIAIDPKSRYILQTGYGDFDIDTDPKSSYFNQNVSRLITKPESTVDFETLYDRLTKVLEK